MVGYPTWQALEWVSLDDGEWGNFKEGKDRGIAVTVELHRKSRLGATLKNDVLMRRGGANAVPLKVWKNAVACPPPEAPKHDIPLPRKQAAPLAVLPPAAASAPAVAAAPAAAAAPAGGGGRGRGSGPPAAGGRGRGSGPPAAAARGRGGAQLGGGRSVPKLGAKRAREVAEAILEVPTRSLQGQGGGWIQLRQYAELRAQGRGSPPTRIREVALGVPISGGLGGAGFS